MAKGSTSKQSRKTNRPFKDFHSGWIDTLRSSLLPLLRHSLSSSATSSGGAVIISSSLVAGGALLSSPSDLLSAHSAAVLSHFNSYYHALDLAAASDPSQLLAPSPWRSPVELPFLWLGDYHPSLFTNLLRTLDLDSSRALISKVEQLERGIRLIAPSIAARFRDAQARFVQRAASEWKETGKVSEESIASQMEEMESCFADANRLRRSILGEIMGAADVYQGATFLEALADFVVGFWDPKLLHEFEQSKMLLSHEKKTES